MCSDKTLYIYYRKKISQMLEKLLEKALRTSNKTLELFIRPLKPNFQFRGNTSDNGVNNTKKKYFGENVQDNL